MRLRERAVLVSLIAALAACSGPAGPAPSPAQGSPTAGPDPSGAQASPSGPAATPSGPPASPRLYVSSALPYTIELAPGWVGEGDEWIRSDPKLIAFVGSSEPPQGVDLEEYVSAAVAPEGESSCSTDPVDIVDTTMGGEPAHRILYTCDGTAFSLVATGHSGRRYVLGLDGTDLDAVRQATDELLATFRFTD